MNEEATLNNYVGLACLPTEEPKIKWGSTCYISGIILSNIHHKCRCISSQDTRIFDKEPTIVAKVLGHFALFYSALNFHPPPPPQTMLFFVRSTWGNGKISRAQQCLVSHRRNNIVFRGAGVRVQCKDEEVERAMFFKSYFSKCPKDFWRLL